MKTFALLSALALVAACSPSQEDEPTPMASEAVAPSPVPLESAERALPPPIPMPTAFRALGTEPFWSADVEGTRLKYSTPESPESATITVVRKDAGKSVVYTGAIDGKPLELQIRRETCSDGMSDTVYPFKVMRRIGPDDQHGCAR